MQKVFRLFLWTGVLALLGFGAWYALVPQPVEVETATIARGKLQVTVNEDGVTRIRNRYVVSSNVGGSLLRIDLKPGDTIRQGETLIATLQPNDPSMLDARQLAQARATLEAARTAIERADARKEQAIAAFQLAEARYGRVKQLFEQNSIPRDEYDLSFAARRAREEDLHVAEFERKIADFEFKQAEAALAYATSESDLDRIRILAPIDGRVLRVLQESATVINPGTPLVEVGNPADLEIVVDVLSSDAVKIADGNEVELEHWGGERPLKARVRLTEPAAFTKISALGVEEQRVNVIADFTEDAEVMARLGDGYRVEARIIVWSGEDVIRVPTSALFREEGKWMVFRVDGSMARKTELNIGRRNTTHAEVVEGLSPGDIVIVYPGDAVLDGVEIIGK